MGLLDTVRPVLGYVIAIAIIIILAAMGFMAVVSSELVSSATTMAQVLSLTSLFSLGVYHSCAARWKIRLLDESDESCSSFQGRSERLIAPQMWSLTPPAF